MHMVWISMKITVSELKQPWSVLLQSKNSAIFRTETAIIRTENLWSLLKTTEHRSTFMNLWTLLKGSENRWISMKNSGHLWKCLSKAEQLLKTLNITENVCELLWTSMKISARLWKCLKKLLKISENYYFNSETVRKPLLALFTAKWSSTYVLSTFYELHLKKPQKKKKISYAES